MLRTVMGCICMAGATLPHGRGIAPCPAGGYVPRVKAAVLILALIAPLALAAAVAAGADGGCVITPTGIDCSAEGTSSTSGGTPGTTIPAPPLRYLATTEHPDDGLCWFWSPYPPGLDSWDPANDMEILWTRWALPECPDPGPGTVIPGHVLGRDPGLGGLPLLPPGGPAPRPAAGAARHHRPPLVPVGPAPRAPGPPRSRCPTGGSWRSRPGSPRP